MSPPASRWRWRPGAVLCSVAALAFAWLAVLNVLAATAAFPDAAHGRHVSVVVRSCDAGGCRGDYRLGGRLLTDQEVEGVTAPRIGEIVHATVDADAPGKATVGGGWPVVGEAAVLALAFALIAVLCLRAALRARRRTTAVAAPPSLPPLPSAPEQAEPDPLAWVRKRRFGAQ
jgi:hypothetical protein